MPLSKSTQFQGELLQPCVQRISLFQKSRYNLRSMEFTCSLRHPVSNFCLDSQDLFTRGSHCCHHVIVPLCLLVACPKRNYTPIDLDHPIGIQQPTKVPFNNIISTLFIYIYVHDTQSTSTMSYIHFDVK
jgi:hypothetical protein